MRDDKGLTVATSDPGNIGGLDDVAFRLGFRLRTVLAPDREVDWAIRRYHQGDRAPCPPPRLRRAPDESFPTQAPVEAPPASPLGGGPGTPASELAQLAATAQRAAQAAQQAAAQQSTQPPRPTVPWTSPSTAPTEAELMMRETAHLLRLLVEACVHRGVFTREDYLNKLRSL